MDWKTGSDLAAGSAHMLSVEGSAQNSLLKEGVASFSQLRREKPVGLPQGHPSAEMGSLKDPGVRARWTPSAFASNLCLLPAVLPQGLGS